jgi:hypothetical protein
MWEKLGFAVRGGKDVHATLTVDGVIVARTKRSHGSGKLDGKIPHFIRQKMYLNENQFDAAYNCPMQKPEYFAILKSKGHIKDRPPGVERPPNKVE